jgi:hypothetical protein
MTFSLFDWLVISIRPKEHTASAPFSGLTAEEIRELQRMRQEVKLAREQAKLFVSQTRGGAV